MNTLVTNYVDVALERELEAKRVELSVLEETCAQRELDLATNNAEIETFRQRYIKRVVPLYAQLDQVEADIRAFDAALNLGDVVANKEAKDAREQAKRSYKEAHEAKESNDAAPNQKFQASESLKKIFRKAAKLIHPDRAADDNDRAKRNDFMSKINTAYSRGAIHEIEELIDQYLAGQKPSVRLTPREEIGQINMQISKIKNRLVEIERNIRDLLLTDIARMMRDVELAEGRNEDPLSDLCSQIEAQISERLNVLQERRAKFKEKHKYTSDEDGSTATNADTTQDEPPLDEPADQRGNHEAVKPNGFRKDGLIHITDRGEKVRSKSEVIIANMLYQLGVEYIYEYPVEGTTESGIRRPDFTFFTKDKEILLWEHLGMLHDSNYAAKWESKLAWYRVNGFVEGESLFVTRDNENGSMDSQAIRIVAEQVLGRLSC